MKYSYGLGSFNKFKNIHHIARYQSSKVPVAPVQTFEKNRVKEEVIVDKNTIALLERLSLVKTDPVEGVKVLEDSIAFANQILHINTDAVEPLYSVLEERYSILTNLFTALSPLDHKINPFVELLSGLAKQRN